MDVVITSYNARAYVLPLVADIRRVCPAARIVVVDDASTDGTAEALRAAHPEIELVVHEENLGYTAAANDGLARARHDAVFLLNADLRIRTDVLTPLAEFLRKNPRAGAVAPRIENADGTTYRNLVIGEYDAKALLDHSLVSVFFARTEWFRRRHRKLLLRDDAEYERAREDLASVSFAFAGFRYDALAAAGGLDEGFRIYFEDPDLTRRMRAAGYQIAYLPVSGVLHYGKAVIGGAARAFPIWSESRIRFLAKYGPRAAILPARLLGILGAVALLALGAPGWDLAALGRAVRANLVRAGPD